MALTPYRTGDAMKKNMRTSNGNLYRKNRAWLRAQGLPCALCGKPIDYSLPGGDPWSC